VLLPDQVFHLLVYDNHQISELGVAISHSLKSRQDFMGVGCVLISQRNVKIWTGNLVSEV
jgi:hypothetical protein